MRKTQIKFGKVTDAEVSHDYNNSTLVKAKVQKASRILSLTMLPASLHGKIMFPEQKKNEGFTVKKQ